MSQRAHDQSPRIPGSTASKKVRMTMACERCRSKKVKCDFAHPSCSRCQQAKAQCSYDGSATQVDLFNLVKLNETVDMLQQRVHSIETDLKDVSTNTQFVADEFRMTRSSAERASQSAVVGSSDSNSNYNNNFAAMNSLFASSSNSNGQWSLSLTPRGLRIDTNIISLHDLYNILLTGVSRIDLDSTENTTTVTATTTTTTASSNSSSTTTATTTGCNHNHQRSNSSRESDASSTSSGASTSVPELDRTTIARKKNLWKTKLKTFPLYSTWEPHRADAPNDHAQNNNSNNENAPEMMSQETCDELMDIYDECLLCLPCADLDDSVADRYKKGTLDPLLQYAALAWTARHAAIYHDLFPGRDPNLVGEQFFDKAKELLKERFTTTDIDTMHGLIIMYVYAIGRPDERRNSMQSEAYIYLGLAIRMCLNMKMFQESTSPDPIMREKHRRFFWALYFLETLCTVHSDKAFSLPPEDLITVSFPTVLPHEVGGEKQWRVLFTSQRFRITRIYRNIIYKTAHEKPLLSSISTLDKDLDDWLDQLVPEFKYTAGDINRRDWASSSFREQGCIKLNSEYNFQLCQLYSLFASKSEQRQPSAIDLLTNERCKVAADNIVDLLECFSRLKQRWCHFSLETTMIATMVYGSMLSSPNSEWPRQQLQRMLTILSNSPVQHHKYVFALTKRIEKMLAEQRPDDDLDLDEDEQQQRQQEEFRDEEEQQQQQEDTIIEKTDERIPEQPPAAPPPQHQQDHPAQVTRQPSPCQQQQPHPQQQEEILHKVDMLDMPSAIFDLTKETTVDPLQFLYTPSVMGLCTAPHPHASMLMVSTPTPQPAATVPSAGTTPTANGGFATPATTTTAFGSPSTPMTYYSSSASSPPYHMPPHHHQHQHQHHHQQQQPPPAHPHPHHHHHQQQQWHHSSTPFGNFAADQPLPQYVNMEGMPLQNAQPQQNSKKRSNTDDFGYYR